MALLALPSYEIPSPPIEPPLHGLLDTAYTPEVGDLSEEDAKHIEAGFTFIPNPPTCGHVQPWAATCEPVDKADPGDNSSIVAFHSFVLTYSTECHALPSQLSERVKAAERALAVGTGQAVEAIFWGPYTGGPLEVLSSNFSLSGSTPLVTGGADFCSGILNVNGTGSDIVAYSPKQAQLALSQALGNCALGARGFLHAPVYVAEDWAEQGLIVPSDPKDRTSKLITNVRGDYVVGGSGYSGTGPEGHPLETPAEGHAWVYASGPVGVRLGEITSQETTLIDRATNLQRIIVERTVSIAASETCLFAAYVDVA